MRVSIKLCWALDCQSLDGSFDEVGEVHQDVDFAVNESLDKYD